jgi:hypothetical protein
MYMCSPIASHVITSGAHVRSPVSSSRLALTSARRSVAVRRARERLPASLATAGCSGTRLDSHEVPTGGVKIRLRQ